ncbi:MAG: adenosylcobinamide-GDP ribazoletransferase [Acidobacteria bacterium]|nr:adenosylcobinamide-GDP ribazoletransferase [Acidobacteriota bacterium]
MRQAIQFLTILPVNAPPGQSAWAFPLVGVLLGLALAWLWPLKFGSLLIIILLAVLTGGLHEDGLADVFDAIRFYRTREKMLLIMKDSRIGAHGALALMASFVFRWQALAALQGDYWLRIPAVFGISRAVIVLLAATTPPAGEGLGRGFIEGLPSRAGSIAAVQAIVLAAMAGWPAAGVLLFANTVAILLIRRWFVTRLGGVTGDCLGAACQVSEAVSLGVLACL